MMEYRPPEPDSESRAPATGGGERLVYVVPAESMRDSPDDEIDLIELMGTFWRDRWLLVAITTLFAAGSIAYSLIATEWYKAEVLLAPTEQRTTQGLAAQFGGLANLAGISIEGAGSAEQIAVLESRDFAREFIEDQKLVPVLLADQWDEEAGRWKGNNPEEWPDWRDAVTYFDERVRHVSEDTKTGLVTLEVEWTDGEVAAMWADLLVQRLNDRMRKRAQVEAERNIAYLQAELATTNVVTLQQSIGRLLESELQQLMLAKGNEEFSFRVIDRAEVPKRRSSPKRTLIVVVTTFLGGALAVVVVLARSVALRRREGRAE